MLKFAIEQISAVVRSPIVRRGGELRRGRFNRRAHAGGRRRVDARAEHDEVQQRLALAGRQRERVHVGLEVSLVAGVRQRVVERVEEPVAGEGHRAAERAPACRRADHRHLRAADQGLGAASSGVATSTHESAAVTTASPLDVLTSVLELPPDAPMPDWPPKATLIVSGASSCW